MSSCLRGGIEMLKSPSPSSTWTSASSSPSSTLSESSNSPLAISTRKRRTTRKRLNQTYNEAIALLSTACPKIFPPKHITKPSKFTNPHDNFFYEPSELLLPIQEKPDFGIVPSVWNCGKKIPSRGENDSQVDLCEDFDAESILDEEIEAGIDSIMGNVSVNNESIEVGIESIIKNSNLLMRRGERALRHVDEREWWRFPIVDVLEISPQFNGVRTDMKKKKKKIKKSVKAAEKNSESEGNSIPRFLLKLNYEEVVNAWSDRGTPFSEEISGNDFHARMAEIDLLSEREDGVLNLSNKEKPPKSTQRAKVNAGRRPKTKGKLC